MQLAREDRTGRPWQQLLPGLALTAAATALSWMLASAVSWVSPLTAAVVLGVLVGNVPVPASVRPGLRWATRVLLRVGVVLLGVQLAVGQVLHLGAATLVVVVVAVVVTYVGTVAFGRLLGVSRGLSVLVATGFSICGASAIMAVEGVVDRDDEDVATSVAMVTVFGGAAMALLPSLAAMLGWAPAEYGRIAGGSVHEVAQVVAAASPVGTAAVAVAVVVKLSRVVLLAPLVALLSQTRRIRVRSGERPPVLPWFVTGFLLAMLVRSTGLLPAAALAGAQQVTTVLMAGSLFALGTSMRLATLARTGPKALVLGAASTALITGVTIAGVLVTA